MVLGGILFVLILVLITVVPLWPHAKGWGYRPVGVVVIAMVIAIALSEFGFF